MHTTSSGNRSPSVELECVAMTIARMIPDNLTEEFRLVERLGDPESPNTVLCVETIRTRHRFVLKLPARSCLADDVFLEALSRRSAGPDNRLATPLRVGRGRDGRFFTIAEHCPAGSLRTRLAEMNRLPDAAIRPLVRDLAAALVQLHQNLDGHRIIHCDLKPSNVLVARRGSREADWEFRLSDFDSAVLMPLDDPAPMARTVGGDEEDPDGYEQKILDGVRNHFHLELQRPELHNRLGENIVVFDYIVREVAVRILGAMIGNVTRTCLEDTSLELEIEESGARAIGRDLLRARDAGLRGPRHRFQARGGARQSARPSCIRREPPGRPYCRGGIHVQRAGRHIWYPGGAFCCELSPSSGRSRFLASARVSTSGFRAAR